MVEFLRFEHNVPVEVKYVTDRYLMDEDRVEYALSDGRIMRLPSTVAASINLLEIQPGESFMVCRRHSGDASLKPRWDIWLTRETEQKRAASEAPGLLTDLRRSLAAVNERACLQGDIPQPSGSVGWNGTGSQEAADLVAETVLSGLRGEAPAPPPIAAAAACSDSAPEAVAPPPATGTMGPQPVPMRSRRQQIYPSFQAVPINVAFQEMLAVTVESLKAAGQMWGPEQVQDMVSTMMIQAGQSGWLAPWERK